MIYQIYLDEELLCSTDWAPMAQAAWHRASRDRDAAQHGGEALFVKSDVVLARVQPRTLHGHPWPDRDVEECDLRDVLKSMLMLLKHAGVNTQELAQACTESGLPMTRSRIDALRGSTPGKRTAVCEAEIVCLLHAAIGVIKNEKS